MRQCNCSGNCGPRNNDFTRREFLGLLGAGTAATLVASPAWGAFELPADELERWRRSLLQPAAPRLYDSARHTDARMHLGGIGTGNFEVGVDGQFTTWQLFNTLRDGHVPFHFAIKAGKTTRLLQTAGGPDWPRVQRIEMTGEYPLATLRFHSDDLPVQLELTAFSPFVPLDDKTSSLPVAAFHFRIHNPTTEPQAVALAAFLTNPIGYDAAGEIQGVAHPKFGANLNEVFQQGAATGLRIRAEPGQPPTLDQPVFLYAMANLRGLKSPPNDRPELLKLELLDPQVFSPGKLPAPARTVLLLEEPAADLSEAFLRNAREAVEAGATLIFSGASMPLLAAYAAVTRGKPLGQASARPDIVFEDFEKGYENWTVEGEAFGKTPVHGTLPNQQPVSGFLGHGLVNSYVGGDDMTGKLTSKSFTIERHFIRVLIGGGRHARTQLRLIVGGKVVRAMSGKDNERLEPAAWEVHEFAEKTAHLEIVDEQKGGWGHINVDQIVFSDEPTNRAALELLEAILPARFSGLRSPAAKPPGRRLVEFENLELPPGSKSATHNGQSCCIRKVGKGQVVLVAGEVLDPAQAEAGYARQQAYALVCSLAGARFTSMNGPSAKAPGFGTITLATSGVATASSPSPQTTVLTSFEDWSQAWKQFTDRGSFDPPGEAHSTRPTLPGQTVHGAVAASVIVPPAGTVEIPFVLAWHYPNKYNGGETWMGCHYATQWPNADAVASVVVSNYAVLREQTELFRKTLYDSTLPYWLLDCLTANAAIIRHIGVVFRIANGDTYGWEGSNGCCTPTCTHVWGYEQTLARLFPALEKDMRRIDFKHQQRPDGGVNNRTDLPSPPHPSGEHPFADGHASCILKAYREALNHPDDSFFKEYWPHIKRAVEYLIDRDAKSSGGTPAGILQDDQWNTYDEALHGVTTFISGYYLAALRAGEEWARRMGEPAVAERFRGIFEKGQARLLELCWNGEYFQQHLPDYLTRHGEFGPGCMSDQLIAQWWAHQLGLGYILPQEKVRAAMQAIFKYNFKTDLTGWKHAPRAFAGAKDKGLIVCTWPKGGRPANVMLYSDEVWTGIEYQVAAHLIYEGLVTEGLAIVKAARDRYDGLPRAPIQRNPWNEIECGGHYARAMSSWSLLLTLSGYEYDGGRKALRLGPRHRPENFKSFLCGPEGWGSFSQRVEGGKQRAEIAVKWGKLAVQTLSLALVGDVKPANVTLNLGSEPVPTTMALKDGRAEIQITGKTMSIEAGKTLDITLA